jgi:type I restriction enzyme M protein
MNLYLHGIGGDDSPITVGDTPISDPGIRFDKVLLIHHLVERVVSP